MHRCQTLIAVSFAVALTASALYAFTAKKGAAEIDPQAAQIMRRFGECASGLTSFTVTVDSRLDAARQPPRSAVLKHRISVRKPGNLRVETLSGDNAGLVIAGGRKLTLYLPALKKYQERDTPPRPEQAMAAAGLGGMFLTALFAPDPAASYMEGLATCSYIGQDQVDGQTADHLRFVKAPDEQGKSFAWEVWFRHDAPVLPLKMVPEFAGQPAEAEFLYAGWQVNPALAGDLFLFTPPEGVEKSETVFGEAVE